MAASALTNLGQTYALYGTSTPNGGISNLVTHVKLYTGASTPNVNGTGFTEVANGNGYTTGGIAISRSSWTNSLVSGNQTLLLADQTWTATGSIANIAGAYLTDGSGNVVAWFDVGYITNLPTGNVLVATECTITIEN